MIYKLRIHLPANATARKAMRIIALQAIALFDVNSVGPPYFILVSSNVIVRYRYEFIEIICYNPYKSTSEINKIAGRK